MGYTTQLLPKVIHVDNSRLAAIVSGVAEVGLAFPATPLGPVRGKFFFACPRPDLRQRTKPHWLGACRHMPKHRFY